jgi:hypothetical protein
MTEGDTVGALEENLRRKAVFKDWLGTALEILKWAFVVWLLWPIVELGRQRMSVARVVAGICLFVVFSGKLFYDTLITEFVRQRRTTAKQDLMALLGMIAAVVLLAGLVIGMVGLMITQWQKSVAAGDMQP